MEKIKIWLDESEYSVKEVCLMVTNEYCKDETTVEEIDGNIVITAENESYIDKIYGRKIMNRYYFARHQFISKEIPDIDYYEEFNFGNGTVLNIG